MKIILFIAIGMLVGLIFSIPEIKKIILMYRTPICRIGNIPLMGQVQVVGRADIKNTKSLLVIATNKFFRAFMAKNANIIYFLFTQVM